MRRCKYFYKETWCYEDNVTKQIETASGIVCTRGRLPYVWDGQSPLPCLLGKAICYTPVELDPEWQNIFDETNRRLNDR